MLQSILQHPYFQLGIAILAPLSIAISYILYRKSLRVRVPRYTIYSRTLVSASKARIADLTFAYKGMVQANISVTRVGFWNDGRETIRRSDLIAGDPLRIEIPEKVEVLDATIVSESSKGISSGYSRVEFEGKKVVLLHFEYLDYRDGFVVQIVHNGAFGSSFHVTGKIAGTPGLDRFRDDTTRTVERTSARFAKLFGKKPRHVAFLAFSVYGCAGLVGVSLWFFGYDKDTASVLAFMGLPALLIAPGAFRRGSPLDVREEKSA